MKYANLVIDNKSDQTDQLYTYGVKDDAKIGSKEYVPFARSRNLREAYVVETDGHSGDELGKRLRYIEKVDDDVSLSEEMIRTALWMKKRYICRLIDAVNCFTPVGEKARRGQRKNPFAEEKGEPSSVKELTLQQAQILQRIGEAAKAKKHMRFLLHGVTGSGKTEIYIRAAQQVLEQGRNVIVLVPEIALTGQIIDRFIGRFGSGKVAVLHSKLSLGERYDQWKKVRDGCDGDGQIVIGARSAVFAPLENIGLIVIDEEHEPTYKSEQTPRYHARETALRRAQTEGASVVLGSATPSMEAMYRAKNGEYVLMEMKNRSKMQDPAEVYTVDMRKELKNGNRSILSEQLQRLMKERLEKKEQTMLFLNRRGYSGFVSCRECGHVIKCPHCDVSLSVHRDGKMRCHYCGYEQTRVKICPECGSDHIGEFRAGTQQIEEIVKTVFPQARVLRMDQDSTAAKDAHEKLLAKFARHEYDIMVGTQMVAKGLDFEDVTLVGVLGIDSLLFAQGFRAYETVFSLITQVVGRSGRAKDPGFAIIQTTDPDNPVLNLAAAQDYDAFFEQEIAYRKLGLYPPFCGLCVVGFSGPKEVEVARAAARFLGWVTAPLRWLIRVLTAPLAKILRKWKKTWKKFFSFSRLWSTICHLIGKHGKSVAPERQETEAAPHVPIQKGWSSCEDHSADPVGLHDLHPGQRPAKNCRRQRRRRDPHPTGQRSDPDQHRALQRHRKPR